MAGAACCGPPPARTWGPAPPACSRRRTNPRAEADTSSGPQPTRAPPAPCCWACCPTTAGPAPALLRVPRSLRRIDAPRVLPPARGGAIRQRREHPDQAGYERGVSAALERIARADGRPQAWCCPAPWNWNWSTRWSCPRSWRGCGGPARTATPTRCPYRKTARIISWAPAPELLVRREGRRVRVHPLAGTAARHPDATEDARIARALLDSPKDLLEHAVVVEAIEAALRPLCRTLDIPEPPA